MNLTDDRLREMRAEARKTTKGRWGAWGMALLAGESGMTADTAEHVADFYTRDGQNRPRTFDLNHVVNFQPRNAEALVDEVLRHRAALRRIADPTTSASVAQLVAQHALAPDASLVATLVRHRVDHTTGTVSQLDPSGEWVPAEPLPMLGWRGRLEEHFRRNGWTRLADAMARSDERGLG